MHSNNHWLPKTLASATQATEEQPSSSPAPGIDLLGMFEQFNNPQGYLMVGTLVILLALSRLAPRGSKITSGRVAGPTEHLAAASIALKQMKSKKHNKVTLWCGEPRYWFGKGFKGASARLQALLNNPSTLWLPDMQRSMLVIGQPGSGKSFSVIDPAIESAMQQGFPILLYDKKGSQMELHGPLAARYGYKVYVFAPGEPYSPHSARQKVAFLCDRS